MHKIPNFNDPTNFYAILGIERKSTQEHIEKISSILKKNYNPENAKDEDKEEAEIHYQMIEDAHRILSSPMKRRIYDYFGMSVFNNFKFLQKNQNRMKLRTISEIISFIFTFIVFDVWFIITIYYLDTLNLFENYSYLTRHGYDVEFKESYSKRMKNLEDWPIATSNILLYFLLAIPMVAAFYKKGKVIKIIGFLKYFSLFASIIFVSAMIDRMTLIKDEKFTSVKDLDVLVTTSQALWGLWFAGSFFFLTFDLVLFVLKQFKKIEFKIFASDGEEIKRSYKPRKGVIIKRIFFKSIRYIFLFFGIMWIFIEGFRFRDGIISGKNHKPYYEGGIVLMSFYWVITFVEELSNSINLKRIIFKEYDYAFNYPKIIRAMIKFAVCFIQTLLIGMNIGPVLMINHYPWTYAFIPFFVVWILSHILLFIVPYLGIRFIKDIKELMDFVEKIKNGGDVKFEIENNPPQ